MTGINDDLRLIEDTSGLRFGTDALLLASFLRKAPGAEGIELGAGSGVISLLAAVRGKLKHVTAVEVQKKYADLIGRNASLNGLSERVTPLCLDVRELKTEADVIFSNPPYLRADAGFPNESEEKFAARHEVYGTITDFCAAAARNLKYGGLFYVVYRPDRMTDLFSSLREKGLEPKRTVFVSSTPAHEPSLLLVEAKKGAAPGMKLLPLLFLKNADGTDSDQMKRIYETGDMKYD